MVDPEAVQAGTVDAADTFYDPLDGYGENGLLLNMEDGTLSETELPSAGELGENRLFLPMLNRNHTPATTTSDAQALASASDQPQAYDSHVYMSSIHVPKLADFSQLQRGDVMLKNGKGSDFPVVNYSKYYSHNALFQGNQQTYESNFHPYTGSTVNGVRLLNINRWNTALLGSPVPVAFARSNDASVRNQVSAAVDWAITTYGNGVTGYNGYMGFWWDANSNKNYEGYGLYCSQLVWKTYSHIGGTNSDIDSDSADLKDYLVAKLTSPLGTHLSEKHVLPDETYLDSNLSVIDRGLNFFP